MATVGKPAFLTKTKHITNDGSDLTDGTDASNRDCCSLPQELTSQRYMHGYILLNLSPYCDTIYQSLSQRSKIRTFLADTGSVSGATFQCMQFLPFLSIFSYLFKQIPEDRATLLLFISSSHIAWRRP